MKRTRTRKRRSSGLGMTSNEHAGRAASWLRSATQNLHRIAKITNNPCSTIEHYTDVIAEATVAENEAQYAGDKVIALKASTLTRHATEMQRSRVYACARTGGWVK